MEIYLLYKNANIETLEYILQNNNINQYINIQRPDKKNTISFCCKYFNFMH